MDNTHEIHLTERGKKIARDIYERNSTFRQLLTEPHVDEKTAAADACEMEHAVSKESYETWNLKKWMLTLAVPEHCIMWPLIVCPLVGLICAGIGALI